MVGNSNADGKSPIEYVLRDSVAREMADTIPDVLIEDKFDTITRSANFLSFDRIKVGDTSKPMTCSVKLKFVWPKSINNSTNLDDLYSELLSRISLTNKSSSLDKTIEYLLSTPEFAQPSSNFTTTSSVDNITTGLSNTLQHYRVFPYICTNYLLEMVVLIEKNNGAKMSRNMNIVHYDRVHHNVLSIDKIFDLSHIDDILALVNQSIESEKMTGTHDNWHETNIMPTEFLLGRKSVVFYLADGAIAPRGTGLHEISVSNSDLEPFFTSYYNEILANDSHFSTYDFVTM
jgi:hypothetical protein